MQDIKDYLSYDPLTGLFTRIKGVTGNHGSVGNIAGGKDSRGYIVIKYKNKDYKAHRLAWYFTYGYLPNVHIDHINEIPSDNRVENLRLDIHRQNQQNVSKPITRNKSGFKGVTWHNNKWRSTITVNRKQKFIGSYDTPEEAHAAYLCAKRERHPFWVENK